MHINLQKFNQINNTKTKFDVSKKKNPKRIIVRFTLKLQCATTEVTDLMFYDDRLWNLFCIEPYSAIEK